MLASEMSVMPARVRRAQLVHFYMRDRDELELSSFLEGTVRITTRSEVVAVVVHNGREHSLAGGALELLRSVPANSWSETAQLTRDGAIDSEVITDLLSRGLLVSDDDDPLLSELRRRDETLAEGGWDRHAALYHFTSKWSGHRAEIGIEVRPGSLQDLSADIGRGFDHSVDRYGPPPPHFHERDDSTETIVLGRGQRPGAFFDVLTRRRSTRLFQSDRPLELADLTTILYYVWGCQGVARLSDDVVVLRKTSPSGGALHPVEVYPLVRSVTGLEPGVYHYDVGRHALGLLQPMEGGEVAETILELTSGQGYFSSAQVLFLLTVRFYRNFWKYRNHKKAYRVVLLDAAHLSQTLFLVAEELGLGAFTTAAVNEVEIERLLGLDGIEESAVAVCGCGIKLDAGVGMTLACEPYAAGDVGTRSSRKG